MRKIFEVKVRWFTTPKNYKKGNSRLMIRWWIPQLEWDFKGPTLESEERTKFTTNINIFVLANPLPNHQELRNKIWQSQSIEATIT